MNNKFIDLKQNKKQMINTERDNKILYANKLSRQQNTITTKNNFYQKTFSLKPP